MNRLRMGFFATLLGLSAGLAPVGAQSHEFWVEPSAFTIEPGGRIGVRLCVGDGFEGWSLARNTRRIEKFIAAGPAGEQPVVGLDESDPAGIVRLATPGGYVIAYRSNRALTELPAAEFDEYLRDKGMDKIALQREERGPDRGKVREAYSRHAKALIRVGDPDGSLVDRPMNLRLELIAEPDLLHAGPDDPRAFRLLHDGKPLAGALVVATRPGTADVDLKARTDADGRAVFRLRAAGMWRVAAVHMIEAHGNVAADWESLWASLTFELPSHAPATVRATHIARGATCRNKVVATTAGARP